MTLPAERTLATLQTREFLQVLSVSTDVPSAIRSEAKRLLRHFPMPHDISAVVRAMSQIDSPLHPEVFCTEDEFHPTLQKFFKK